MKPHPEPPLPAPRAAARRLCAAAIAACVAGCASTPPGDPLEPYNRAMFSFNEKLDKVVLKPAARAYVTVTPALVRTCVGNFFGNFNDPWISLNNLLQGKPAAAASDVARFLINSTAGLGGLFDIATEMRLIKHDEDFGQTLGHWGIGEGMFLVLPFFGPSTLRDTLALPLDITADDSWKIVPHVSTRNVMSAVQITNERARALGLERTLEEGTLDQYRYARDFYLQQRRYRVLDGNVPMEYDDFDLDERVGEGVGGPGSEARNTSGTPSGEAGNPHEPHAGEARGQLEIHSGEAGGQLEIQPVETANPPETQPGETGESP
ncbi:MAG: VacJ family lipoprotein [Azoarcus sp.]|jgi:phospholipid-binding lipoprotein MlaA|nr:VacJ family lipoprotein [Azoarcus sp.]